MAKICRKNQIGSRPLHAAIFEVNGPYATMFRAVRLIGMAIEQMLNRCVKPGKPPLSQRKIVQSIHQEIIIRKQLTTPGVKAKEQGLTAG